MRPQALDQSSHQRKGRCQSKPASVNGTEIFALSTDRRLHERAPRSDTIAQSASGEPLRKLRVVANREPALARDPRTGKKTNDPGGRNRDGRTIPGVDEPLGLQYIGHWRMAVSSLLVEAA